MTFLYWNISSCLYHVERVIGAYGFDSCFQYKMKIKLEYPFTELYKSGYLLQNKEPRRLVLLVRFDNTKTSVSYARYLMSCHLKRFLTLDEQVDHIDNDKLNDTIENLQILTIAENNNNRLDFYNAREKIISFVCPVCNIAFERKNHIVNHKIIKGKIITCSRQCGGIWSHITKQKNKNSIEP